MPNVMLLTQNQPGWFLPFLIGLIVIAFIQIAAGCIQAIYSLKLDGANLTVIGIGDHDRPKLFFSGNKQNFGVTGFVDVLNIK